MGELFFMLKSLVLASLLVLASQISIRGDTLEEKVLDKFNKSKTANVILETSKVCIDYFSKTIVASVQKKSKAIIEDFVKESRDKKDKT